MIEAWYANDTRRPKGTPHSGLGKAFCNITKDEKDAFADVYALPEEVTRPQAGGSQFVLFQYLKTRGQGG